LRRSVSGSFRENLFQFWLLIPGFVCFTDFNFFPYFVLFLSLLDSFLGDRYFVVTCYYIGWVNQYVSADLSLKIANLHIKQHWSFVFLR
jgi:hypothetical protein